MGNDADVWRALEIAVAILGAGIAGMALARLPHNQIRHPVYALVGAGVLWVIGDLIADQATNETTKQIGTSLLYTGSITIPAIWWMVALRWADSAGARLPLRHPAWQWAPLGWAGLMWLCMISNPVHGAFITPVVGGPNVYHALWYVMALPSYGLVLAALVLEIAVAHRVARRAVRHQAGFLIAASGTTLLGNWLYVAGAVPINLTVLTLSVSVSLLLLGMARDGLFGSLPAALDAIAAEHPEGVVVVGASGHIEYANERAHELLAPLDLSSDQSLIATLQHPWLRPDKPLPAESRAAWQALRGPTGMLFQVQGPRRRWLQVVAHPLDKHSRRGGRLLFLSDITKRRQAELHTAQNRRLDSVAALASTVSRDFQGAFAIVRANAELLEREVSGQAADRHLGRIFEATRVGADLAEQLQIHAGGVHSIRTTLDLADVVNEACNLCESDLASGVYLQHRRSEVPLPVEIDPVHVRDCVFSLLANAIEVTPEEGGRIEVETGTQHLDPRTDANLVWGQDQPPGEFAFVRVSDEGGGMDRRTEERAFEPFFSTRHKDRGTGLSSLLGVVRAHGGAIALENDPGWGCSFTVYLRAAVTSEESDQSGQA